MTNSISDLEEADCFFVIGSNTTEQHPIIAARIMRAQRRGARVVVADPRRIHLAGLADLHLRQRPGTDVALLNGLMHIILREGWEDKEFVAARTEGFAELEEVLAEYTPERVEAITGVPRTLLFETARIYAQAESAAILYAMGITQHTTGVEHVWSCANLAMLTGNVGRPGSGVNPLRGQNNVQGACDMGALPNVFPGYQPVADSPVSAKFAEAWGVKGLPKAPGLTLVEMMGAAREGKVKGMYIVGENPALSDPDSNHVWQALSALEFLVVQDIFLTETAQYADVVLPAACYAEKEGSFTGTDRRVQLGRIATQPSGSAKADWEIVCKLAKALGVEGFDYSSPAQIMEEIASLTPIYGGISHQRLRELGFLQWPCPSANHPGTPYLHRGQFSRGKGLFHAVEHQEAAELPDKDYPFLLTTGRNMFHFHTGTMTRRSEKLVREVSEAYMELNPLDAERLGLTDSAWVEVASRRGVVKLKAQVTGRVPEGVVFIPFHFAEAPANVLTNPALDPVAKIPELKVCAVRVKKL